MPVIGCAGCGRGHIVDEHQLRAQAGGEIQDRRQRQAAGVEPLGGQRHAVGPRAVAMPPAPGVRVTVPLLPSRPGPALSSRMIWPGPAGSWTTMVDAPAVVAGMAVLKVMLPVWLLSPKVTVPPAAVDLDQFGVRQVDAGHRIVRPAQAHRTGRERRTDDHAAAVAAGRTRSPCRQLVDTASTCRQTLTT